MEKNNCLEDSIKTALVFGEDKIELNTTPLKNIKLNLKKVNERKDVNMTGISLFSRYKFKRAIIAVFTLVIVIAGSVTFIQPARVFADNVKSMIYDVIKGDNGKYIAIKVPNEKIKIQNTGNEIPTLDNLKAYRTNEKMPTILNGDYLLYNQSTVAYSPKDSNMLSISSKEGTGPSLKLPEGWKSGTNFWYGKASSIIIVSECDFDSPQVINSKGEAVKGDNQKELTISGQVVVYAEYPDARYPYVNNTEDRTQAPSINVSHTLFWQHDGKYYKVYDFNGDLNLDTLKEAAASVIDSLK